MGKSRIQVSLRVAQSDVRLPGDPVAPFFLRAAASDQGSEKEKGAGLRSELSLRPDSALPAF